MICDCCKAQYDDNSLSCPYCGTATAVSHDEPKNFCSRCGSPVISGQPMCQSCGAVNPATVKNQATMPDVNSAQSSGNSVLKDMYDGPQQKTYTQNNYSANNPYQTNTYNQNPYNQQQSVYGQQQNPYNQQQSVYGQNPYQQQNPYSYNQQQNPYQAPYMQNSLQPYGNPMDPAYQKEVKSVKTMATVAMVMALLIPLVTYILFGIANSKAKRLGYTGSNGLLNIALVVAIINHILGVFVNLS